MPSAKKNLISLYDLVESSGWTFHYDTSGSYIRTPESTIPLTACPLTRYYLLPLSTASSSTLGTAYLVSSAIQHVRFGHLNFAQLKRMHRLGLVKGMVDVTPTGCATCGVCKSRRSSFKKQTDRKIATTRLGRVHIDLVRFEAKAFGGFRYAMVLVDDMTRMCFVRLLREKSDAPEALADFKTDVADVNGMTIGCFRADNGSEWRNDTVRRWAAKHHIRFEWPATIQAWTEQTVKKMRYPKLCMIVDNHHTL